MKETQSQTLMLLVLLIGFAFLAIGLTIGTLGLFNNPWEDPCLAGLPIIPP
ncbi:MAG: hypothetical protein ACFFD2_23785 [Promethearchaeota archaeon]